MSSSLFPSLSCSASRIEIAGYSIGTHCEVQDFFFDENFELRRHDYSVNIAGGFPAAQLMLEYTEANGIRLPSKRRAHTRGPDRRPILDMLMVSMEISDVAFS